MAELDIEACAARCKNRDLLWLEADRLINEVRRLREESQECRQLLATAVEAAESEKDFKQNGVLWKRVQLTMAWFVRAGELSNG